MSLRPSLASVGAAAMLTAGTFGVAIPALAAPQAQQAAACTGNRTCTYVNAGYSSLLGSRSPGSGLENISTANRNKLSSWINYSSTGARFYYKTSGNGTCVPMKAQSRASASSSNPDNDQAESWAFTRSC